MVLSGFRQTVLTLACSVGLVDHRLHDSPPGVDEPVEDQQIGSDVDVRVDNSQGIHMTPEIMFEVEDMGGGDGGGVEVAGWVHDIICSVLVQYNQSIFVVEYGGTILLQSELAVWRKTFSAVPVDCTVKTVTFQFECCFVMSVEQCTSQNQTFSNY